MAKSTYQEPEEKENPDDFSEADYGKDKDMLVDEEVINRDHASETLTDEVVNEWNPPAPDPNFDDDELEEQEKKPKGSNDLPGDEPSRLDDERPEDSGPFVNPELKDESEEKQQEAGQLAARALLEGVSEGIRELGNLVLPISMKRLKKLHRKNEIDLNLSIPLAHGRSESIESAVGRYNAKATDALALSEEYIDASVPILGAEFAKKKVGLTPFQYWAFVLSPLEAKRIIQVGISIRATGNEIIDQLKELTDAYKRYGRPNFSANPPPPPPAAAEDPVGPDQGPIPPAPPPPPFQDPGAMREQSLNTQFDDIQRQNAGFSPSTGATVVNADFVPKPAKKGSDSIKNAAAKLVEQTQRQAARTKRRTARTKKKSTVKRKYTRRKSSDSSPIVE